VRLQFKQILGIKKAGRNLQLAMKTFDKYVEDAEIQGTGEHRKQPDIPVKDYCESQEWARSNSTKSSIAKTSYANLLDDSVPNLNDSQAELANYRATLNPVRPRVKEFIRRRRIPLEAGGPCYIMTEDRQGVWNKYWRTVDKVAAKYGSELEELRKLCLPTLKEQLDAHLREQLVESESDDEVEHQDEASDSRVSMSKPESPSKIESVHFLNHVEIENTRTQPRDSTSAHFLYTNAKPESMASLVSATDARVSATSRRHTPRASTRAKPGVPEQPQFTKKQLRERKKFIDQTLRKIELLTARRKEKKAYLRNALFEVKSRPAPENLQLLLNKIPHSTRPILVESYTHENDI
jgi:hypothetical protein